jgi:regulatory protein
MEARKIVRLHRDRAKRLIHVFSEQGYECSLPLGFRDPQLRVNKRLTSEELDEIRATARLWESERPERQERRRAGRRERIAGGGEISALKAGRDGAINVEIDGRHGLTLADASGLRVGQRLTADEMDGLYEREDEARIGARIDRLTAFRPRSATEIRDRMKRLGIEGPALERAIERRLKTNLGILDDLAFARWWAEHRGARKGRSVRSLGPDLRRKVVDQAAALAAAREVSDDQEALIIAVERARRGLDLHDERHRRRFVGRLARRGFGYQEARRFFPGAAEEE